MDVALHEGFAAAGIETHLVYANDILPQAVDCLLTDNPCAGTETRTFTGGIQQMLAAGALPDVHLVTLGIPCKGASRLNVRHRTQPEMHPNAGHQVLNAVLALQMMDWPPLVLLENVVEWHRTASCSMLRQVLEEQGYDIALIGDFDAEGQYHGLDSSHYGTIERRPRMALLAYPRGLDVSEIQLTKKRSQRTVGEIRIPESEIDPTEYDKGLHLDSERKRARRLTNRIIDDDDHISPSLSAGCYKMRPEDPKFRHPTDPTRWRLPRPEEHARLKGHDEVLIASLIQDTHAHTALGNGTAKEPWVELGRALGCWLLESYTKLDAHAAYISRPADPALIHGPLFAA